MVQVIALYPATEGGHFDFEYYTQKHLPLAAELMGDAIVSSRSTVSQGITGLPPGSPAPFVCMATIVFKDMESMQAAMGAAGAALGADVPNFTNIQPVMQISQLLD